ncbi:MAG: thioredoxin family protein [Carnobacterium sp.]|uniref:Thioredoxin family protein n=1 Tax=Carnobacterium antarcticum TaxID=2126436 RepID=A0ABW4NP93_9LACT|nr:MULTISPECIES: thioredoxin family protein [unclassified Carnobacterium]ALV23010.1 Thioredoxin [Carnobacterium sp. CP1]QQP70882.1 thioredoxin family protein [Carnobacterium sp. CS13]
MKKLATVEEFDLLTQADKVVFFFTADWCGDCTFIKPVMPEIVESYPEVQFIEVDRDRFIDLCGELAIFGIPSFVAFEKGQEVGRFVSKDRKTKEEIEAFIETL